MWLFSILDLRIENTGWRNYIMFLGKARLSQLGGGGGGDVTCDRFTASHLGGWKGGREGLDHV